MIYEEVTSASRARRTLTGAARVLSALKIDGPLVVGLALIAVYGLIVLYSASGQNAGTIVRTLMRLILGTVAMLVLARVNPNFLRRTSPWLYAIGIVLLLVVAAIGHIGMGAQRWLDLGIIRFQPSELMKLAVPMMCAWCLQERPLPPSWLTLGLLSGMILVPVGLVAMQPDLGTAALIAIAGGLVIILAGLQVRVMAML
ncbi:MAG: rod shape-determining protein RodA, partial [Gammaproteobacteria bacterium]